MPPLEWLRRNGSGLASLGLTPGWKQHLTLQGCVEGVEPMKLPMVPFSELPDNSDLLVEIMDCE